MTNYIDMFDSVDVGTVPPNPQAVAGYVGGSWPTYWPLVHAFPKALHLSIAVNAHEDAECLDIEQGDATPDQAGPWVQRQHARGILKPALYANASTMPAVIAALRAWGIPRSAVRLWVADWVYTPFIPAGYDACQWTDRALGRNLDESACLESFFGAATPVDPYAVFDNERGFPSPWKSKKNPEGLLIERQVVLNYDGARKHPTLYARYIRNVLRPQLGWLAARATHQAYADKDANGQPGWDKFHRGERRYLLQLRADGHQVVK